MLDKSIFDRTNAIVDEVGSDPNEISEYLGVRITPAYGSINGMVTIVGRKKRMALNENQPAYQYTFSHYHENVHFIEEHLRIPGFLNSLGFHMDTDTFSSSFTKRMVAYTEKVCNLNAANQMFDGQQILRMIGYDSLEKIRDARKEYHQMERNLLKIHESLRYNSSSMMKYRYAEAKKELRNVYEKIMDLDSEFSYHDYMTIPQIANHYGVPEHYIEYALEAQRIQGADIDVQELKTFDKVFTKKRIAAGLDWQ